MAQRSPQMDLPAMQSEFVSRFSHELRGALMLPDQWTDGLKSNFESVSSIPLSPQRGIILAVIASIEAEQGGKVIGVPLVNPVLNADKVQASHAYTVGDFQNKSGLRVSSYLSLYLWHTANHAADHADVVGVCSGNDFCPPYADIRRVHAETIVRAVSFLQLFGIEYAFNDDGKKYTLRKFD